MLTSIGIQAKQAASVLAHTPTEIKNQVLLSIAENLWIERSYLLSNNQIDIENAQKNSLSDALIDRLTLNADRLKAIAEDLRNVAALLDPIGEVFDQKVLTNGLKIQRRRVPLGVLGVIYESRPNVTIDIAGLALKSGNACILRGGSETINSNKALVWIIQQALEKNNLPRTAVQFIDNPDRNLVLELLRLSDYVDMIIPRGGAKLHDYCRENSRIPVMTGGIGICHLFVDESAKPGPSLEVIRNAKIQRPTVCNALDTVLIHQKIASEFIPQLVDKLAEDGVKFRIEENSFVNVDQFPPGVAQKAVSEDFDTEWLSLILGIKVVSTLDEAIQHIENHSTRHSDGILTENPDNARQFLDRVDSAAVYVNASTRFTDGSQMGLGAEVAISTQRLHARGPMGLTELTTYKWIIQGDYQVRP
jgi:glutamate-5-semialdehyde dehydrogenase